MKTHALFLGNDYIGTSSQLGGCTNDARDCAKFFKPFCGSVTVVVGNKADRAGAMRAGRKWLDRLDEGDRGIIGNSGHGTRQKIGGVYHEAVVWADFELSWDNEMAAMFKDRPRNTLICSFSDSCHSGGYPRGNSKKAKTIAITRCNVHKREPTPPQLPLPGVIYFSACQADEVAWDASFNGRGNGAFTYHLLKSLRELPEGATFNALFKRVRTYLPNDDYGQTPEASASAANMRRIVKPKG